MPIWQTHDQSRSFLCAFCSHKVASVESRIARSRGNLPIFIHVCPLCFHPTFFDDHAPVQVPAPRMGDEVMHLPDSVRAAYNEARDCTGVGAYTAATLLCRKLLMSIAVAKGAEEGLKFVEYIDFLNERHYVPPDSKEWVDRIRTLGNEATHEVIERTHQDAQDAVSFVGFLLKIVYEMPGRAPKRAP